ncbi:MAG: nuclear transport factor 2 family protein [Lachnospiraceae bacterium]|nr:nuclear transport factor 2 family protein [Lachnospiraceae bacterium]
MKKIVTILSLGISILALVGCGNARKTLVDETSEEVTTEEEEAENQVQSEQSGETEMESYNFSEFTNVEITGADLSDFNEEELAVLYQQARYCQAMTEVDTDTMREMVPEDAVFTHMSGRQQTREEYFADIENGALQYFTIGIDEPEIEINGDEATLTYTSVLNANAYGARGTYHMPGTHLYKLVDGVWTSANGLEE